MGTDLLKSWKMTIFLSCQTEVGGHDVMGIPLKRHKLIPAYYDLTWCILLKSIDIQSQYIQPMQYLVQRFQVDIDTKSIETWLK